MIRRIFPALGAALCVCAITTAHAQDTYLIAPRPGTTIPLRYFGMHFHGIPPEVNERGKTVRDTQWPLIPVGAVRLWNAHVRWADLEPDRSQWRFDRFDRLMDLAEKYKTPVIYTLGSTPRWASARPDEPCGYWVGCSAEPIDLTQWELYIQTVARRYRGRIAYYEVWNEPNPQRRPVGQSGYFSGDWPTLLEMTRRAHAVLRREDPAARLLSPAFDGPPSRMEQFLAMGGGQWVDGLAFHYYGPSDAHVAPLTAKLRAMMTQYGLANKPLFNTEVGYGAPELTPGKAPPSPELAAALSVRAMILGAFLGLEGWFHHAWDNDHTGMVDRQGRQRPLHAAYARTQRWLLGLEPLGCQSLPRGLVTCKGRQGQREVVLMWRQEGFAPQTQPWSGPFAPHIIEHALTGTVDTAQWRAANGNWVIGSVPIAFWSAEQ